MLSLSLLYLERTVIAMSYSNQTPLHQLDSVISETVSHIHDFTKSSTDFTRNRKLNAETTIKTILNMQGNSLNAELLDAFPDINDRMTASAFEQAKDKLQPDVFKHILNEYNQTDNPKLFNDKYRLLAIDGCDFTVPFNPNSVNVVPTSHGQDICQVHANILYDIENRTYQDCIFQPKSASNERQAAIDMLKSFDTDDTPYIVTMDRGYSSFNMFETCNRLDNCYYCIRTKAGNTAINEIKNLPDKEIDMEMEFDVTTSNHFYTQHRKDMPDLHCILHAKNRHKKSYSKNTLDVNWDFEQFCTIKCRVVKFEIAPDEYEVLVTNLNRFEFPLQAMKDLYHLRWDIEISFRELKYALGGMNFHSKKDDFIEMEIFAHLIMFNAVSRSIACVSVLQTNHKHRYVIDFKMACLIIRKYFAVYSDLDYGGIYVELLTYINPVRPNRADKRNLKTKPAVWFVYRVA